MSRIYSSLFKRNLIKNNPNSRWATMGLFFMFGMLYASWGIHVPTLKEKFGLNEAMLSIALFAMTLGSISALTFTSSWILRVGNRITSAVGSFLMCSAAALILWVPQFVLLLPVLALFGVGIALVDVAMNSEATKVEAMLGRPIMSSLHGMFNIGGMVGAAGGGLLLSQGISPPVHMIIAAAASSVIGLLAYPLLPVAPANLSLSEMQPHPSESEHLLSRDHRILRGVWALGGIALISLIAEGGMYDWLTVYMRETLGASHGVTSAAFAIFLSSMAIGRFTGDAIRKRIGNGRLIGIGGLLASIAMVAALLLFRYPVAALVSFAFVGLGLANMIPVLTLAATRIKGVHAAHGIARVAGMAYIGLLVGPVLIGATAQVTTLPGGLSLVVLCAALAGIIGPRVLHKYCVF